MNYIIHYDIAAAVLSLFILFYILRMKGLRVVSNRFFFALVITNFIAVVADVWSALENQYTLQAGTIKQDLLNYLYLGCHNIMPPLFLFYAIYLMDAAGRIKKKGMFLVSLPYIADVIMLIFNPVNRKVFYYDEAGLYKHGSLFVFFYAIAIFYILSVLMVVIMNKKALTKKKLYPMIFFVFTAAASVAFQIVFSNILIEIFVQSLGLLGILFSIENKDNIIDQTTDVFNRYAFVEDLNSAFHAGGSCVVVKVPSISYYNLVMGAEHTKSLMRDIAQFLIGIDKHFPCYDLGGGHFALLGYLEHRGGLDDICKSILKQFERSWECSEMNMFVPVQISYGVLGKDILSIEEMLLIADSPYDGKKEKVVSAGEALENNKRKLLVQKLIGEALREDGFRVFYQPIWDKAGRRFSSAEALVRLVSQEYGYISPEEFIPVAEQTGQIVRIGEFVFKDVCRFYTENRLEELGVKYIEVNLSAVQCMDMGLADRFGSILRKYGLGPEHINLEITESATAGERDELKKNVDNLSNIGFKFSLDDYGTGYSNFSYMFRMPFKIIKLDRSILWAAMDPKTGESHKNSRILLEDTLRMMKSMGYRTLVEGVETEEQKELLEKLECDRFQGYLFSKPVPEEVFLEFIMKNNGF